MIRWPIFTPKALKILSVTFSGLRILMDYAYSIRLHDQTVLRSFGFMNFHNKMCLLLLFVYYCLPLVQSAGFAEHTECISAKR